MPVLMFLIGISLAAVGLLDHSLIAIAFGLAFIIAIAVYAKVLMGNQ